MLRNVTRRGVAGCNLTAPRVASVPGNRGAGRVGGIGSSALRSSAPPEKEKATTSAGPVDGTDAEGVTPDDERGFSEAEYAAYLEGADEVALASATRALDAMTAAVGRGAATATQLPRGVQIDRSIGAAYGLGGRWRAELARAPRVAAAVQRQAARIRDNLADLRVEAYPRAAGESATDAFRAQLRTLTRRQKEDLLVELRREELARRTRLETGTRELARQMGALPDTEP